MARLFDDASFQYLEVDAAIITSFPFSMSGWFYSDDIDNYQAICSFTDKDLVADRYLLIASGADTGDPVVGYIQDANSSLISDSAATTTGYSANTWHQAGWVGASTTDNRAFIDGGSKGTSAFAREAIPAIDRASIGRSGDSTPSLYMSGRVAEVGFWNVALSDNEMASLGAGISPSRVRTGNLVGYWPCYGAASPEVDFSGGGNNMTVTGATQANHAPVAPPFGFDVGWQGAFVAARNARLLPLLGVS